ncbi:hypothetical protein IT084_09115 [Desulfallas sp. Bu1-1]|uniref:hypothetical protein n=1 Tax=Desulfallas sp. Bu1-1 TaxID=2787620 RepID=UPI00189DC0F1|nr:hypothetical protein [Desulfallas sp. Bu1-1]MBF7083131.1 hypothetical protein [Desulfallas sp. Bu1-1]
MRSRTLIPMMITVFASVMTYYLLATRTNLSENLSMAAGVIMAIICSVALKRIFPDRR